MGRELQLAQILEHSRTTGRNSCWLAMKESMTEIFLPEELLNIQKLHRNFTLNATIYPRLKVIYFMPHCVEGTQQPYIVEDW